MHITARQHLAALGATHGLGEARIAEVLALTGLSSVADKQTGGFSLGMSQRLGLASAILADPQALILDEPINGLDPEGVRWVRDLVRTLASQGRTVFLSSHLMSEMVQTADHIVVIGKGRILADAPVAEILAGSSGIRVRSPQLADLSVHLQRHGAQLQSDGDGARLVTGLTCEQIGTIASHEGCVLYELATVQSSLEDAYLEMTAGAVEYAAGVASWPPPPPPPPPL